MSEVRRALGRGLDALLPAAPVKKDGSSAPAGVFSCAIEKIVPQKGQPRQFFDKEKLEELAASIKEHGIIEPLVVRTITGRDEFELIAGERRWRAAQKAGLREVLVVVKDVSPAKAFELAIVENIQRADLNPIELAEAMDRLLKEHGYTHESLGERLHKDRATVTNTLRLLKLPAIVRQKVVEGVLSEGHARALLGAGDAAIQLVDKVLAQNLSVRATEELVRSRAKGDKKGAAPEKAKSATTKDLERRLSQTLGCLVEVRDRGNKGEIAIPYKDLDALDRLLAKLL